jgi:hypothetical protein
MNAEGMVEDYLEVRMKALEEKVMINRYTSQVFYARCSRQVNLLNSVRKEVQIEKRQLELERRDVQIQRALLASLGVRST